MELGSVIITLAGMYVANRASDKITQLTDNVYVCRSGSVISPLCLLGFYSAAAFCCLTRSSFLFLFVGC